MKICGESDSGAEAEEHAQRVHGNVDNRDAELFDKGRGQEVEQGEEPPCAHEERVVDNRGGVVGCAGDIVTHECGYEDGAE